MLSDLDCLANDFVPDAQGTGILSPATCYDMKIGNTDNASSNFNIDVVVTKGFGLKL
jgi:hypothetical protein